MSGIWSSRFKTVGMARASGVLAAVDLAGCEGDGLLATGSKHRGTSIRLLMAGGKGRGSASALT
jgi:hypothetical protein